MENLDYVCNMRVAIVDLDNTLVGCNSFTEFVKFLFAEFPRMRLRLLWIVGLRKLRLITHFAAKRRIVSFADKVLSESDIDRYLDRLLKRVNEDVEELSRQSGRRILITAAPSIYAERLGARLGFTSVLSSKPGFPEMRGEMKVRAAEQAGIPFDEETSVFTDHHDDLPLLLRNRLGKNYLVRPSAGTRMIVSAASEDAGGYTLM